MPRKYETLDGVRGVGALAVLMLHASGVFPPIDTSYAYLAVDLFFVLSGFVIAHSYDDRLPSMGAGAFFLRRIIRFYPLYLAGLLLGLGVAVASVRLGANSQETAPFGALAPALLFAPVFDEPRLFPFNVPAWSLFFELLINLAYALLFRWLSLPVLAVVLVVSAIGLWAGGASGGAEPGTFLAGFPRVGFSFTAGVLIYRLKLRGPSIGALPVIVLAAAGLLAPRALVGDHYGVVFVLLLSPLIVILGASTEPCRRLAPICTTLGTASFGVYAIHYPINQALVRVMDRLEIEGRLTIGVVFGAAMFAAALLADRFYDRPMRAALTRLAELAGARRSKPGRRARVR